MKKNAYQAYSVLFLLVALAVFGGCSSPNKEPSSFDLSTGRHAADWASPSVHGAWVKEQADGFQSCQECHGSDYTGGISATACFSCHGVSAPHPEAPWRGSRTHTSTNPGNAAVCAQCHTNGQNSSLQPTTPGTGAPGCFNNTLCHGQLGHAAGWSDPTQHGTAAKAANGFSGCEVCHGTNFTGSGSAVSCLNTAGCHGASVSSPHPATPWRGGTYTHTSTDESNAPVCAQCHLNGQNLTSIAPPTPAPAGTAPGCFNATLCHAQAGHPNGWSDPTQHGASAKAANGFSGCETCHGTNFSGSGSAVSCLNTAGCHGASVSSPHPQTPWRGGTYTHTSTDESNAAVCAQCHTNGANLTSIPTPTPAPAGTPPGCFNSTLCHATPGHAAGWSDPAQHGDAAKTGSGFSSCENCHGADFSGGAVGIACSSCHTVNAPHPPQWLPTDTYSHSTTDAVNAPVCALCHLGNRQPPTYAPVPAGSNPGCFNNTLCHAEAGTCLSCHGSSQNGRRVVTGPSGDFVKADHHVTNGTTTEIVTVDACIVCHGDLINDLGHPGGAIPAAPNVQLMNPDTGAYVATTASGVEQVCSACHDGNGATRLGSPTTPFSVAAGDTRTPANIGWTVGQQAHSVSGSYGGCLACHGNAGSANAHGSSQPMMMKYTYNSATNVATASNVCFNCHGTTATNGTTKNVGADFAKTYGHKTVTCFDCHEQHKAKTGSHTNATTLAGVLNGATGKGVTTWNSNNWGGVTTYASTAAATAEWQVCFKCHSGSGLPSGTGAAAFTDLGLEFSPNNASGHPIVTGLNNYTNSTAPKALTAAKMKAPWNVNLGTQTMTCTDCHATDSTASKGPHGSAVKWMLTGTNQAWPYTSASNNGTSSGTLFRIATYSTNQGTVNGLFCLNCHTVTGTNNWHSNSNVTGGQHGGNAIMACASCHIRVPHGGKISRLLQTTNAPGRYTSNGNSATPSFDAWGGSGGIKGSSVSSSNFNSSCSHHNSGTGESW
jgi:hypothetical protein